MTYLDSSCFVKLYYPEPDSDDSDNLISLLQGKRLCYTQLHVMEFTNALHFKIYLKSANKNQVDAVLALVDEDLEAGVLIPASISWETVFIQAANVARQFTETVGCRSLDILHCAAARVAMANEFISTDARQTKLATAMGLNLLTF